MSSNQKNEKSVCTVAPTIISSISTTVPSVPTTISSVPTTVSSVPTTVSSIPTTVSSIPTTVSSVPTSVLSPTSLESNHQTTMSNTCKDLRSSNASKLSEVPKNIESTSVSQKSDEIIALPIPNKQPPPVITLDDEEGSTTVHQHSENSFDDKRQSAKQITSTSSDNGYPHPSLLTKFTAHSEAVNSLVVFEDYLYTCASDSTAKRFSLRDTSSVTYVHTTQIVRDIVVEKINDVIIVCTCNSNNEISFFLASDGRRIKSFTHESHVMSICRGWGKIYSGWADGTIHIYTWNSKHQLIPTKNIVKTSHPISCIATTAEGHLPLLIVLSKEGKIFLRGAESAAFIRRIEQIVEIPSFLTIYKNNAYFYSTYNVLAVLNFATRKIERRSYIEQYVVGIAANDKYLFTVCTNSGLVTCHKMGTVKEKKMYYGAGKRNLTCLHVQNNWVYTGSTKGSISAFKFDPCSSEICKFNSCNTVYGTKEDLAFHVKEVHLSDNSRCYSRCYWDNCVIAFPKDDDIKVKMKHMKMHIF